VDRSAALAAMKFTGALLRLLFLVCRIDSRAVRAGEMDDQLGIARHPPMMDLDSAIFQQGDSHSALPFVIGAAVALLNFFFGPQAAAVIPSRLNGNADLTRICGRAERPTHRCRGADR
jgi:hypothetical protein